LTEKGAMKNLFEQSLVKFEGILDEAKIVKKEKMNALFGDPEVRNFVLKMGYDLLSLETLQLKQVLDTVEAWRLLTGRN